MGFLEQLEEARKLRLKISKDTRESFDETTKKILEISESEKSDK